MPAAPPPPKPGFVTAAVTFFEHTIEVPLEEAELFIRQGFARDEEELKAAIGKARADLEADLGGASAATASGSGAAPAPDTSKPKESTP